MSGGWLGDGYFDDPEVVTSDDGMRDFLEDGGRLGSDMTPAAHDVIDERLRQLAVEGRTLRGDDLYVDGELGCAAAAYAHHACHSDQRRRELDAQGIIPDQWPDGWSRDWFKPKEKRRDLVRAAALILAEIERLDRL